MPKTRDQRCKRALKTLFDQYPFHYNLVKLNVQGYSVARYEISIPQKWITYEPQYNSEAHTLAWVAIPNQQELPNIDTICNKFTETFQPHEKPDAYLRIHDTDVTDECIVIKMIVKYFKSDMPFGEEEITIEQRNTQLENQNAALQSQLSEFESELNRLIRHTCKRNRRLIIERDDAVNGVRHCASIFLEQYTDISDSYRNIIRKCYKDFGQTVDDCPVCYDPIENDKMFVTPCNHILCNDCANHCKNSCPMCRQELCYDPVVPP